MGADSGLVLVLVFAVEEVAVALGFGGLVEVVVALDLVGLIGVFLDFALRDVFDGV